MTDPRVHFESRPGLRRPAFVVAIRGWNDGGEAATLAARYLMEQWGSSVFATLDPEDFVDFQVSRPTVRLEEGVTRVIEWPVGEFHVSEPGERSVVFFTAVEPNMRWRTFCGAVVDVATDLGAETLVTLGAFLTNVPHSRPVPLVGTARTQDETRRFGLSPSQYEGPTGIVGVMHDAAVRAGLPSVSLWAAVPHYLPATSNPKAALAMVERLNEILGVEVSTDGLLQATREWEEGVGSLLEDNEELRDYVRQLEEAVDEGETELQTEVPSGDSIAAELERFLRDRESPGGDVPS
ncbi:MAG TPA: PAC2 family protein [Actinomycetota bacterium]|nr:PAC2 family protein [Actinomycetota bacterium]